VPIQEVEFPTITFCSSGTNEIRTQAYLINLYYEFLRQAYGIKIDLSPLAIAKLFNKVCILNAISHVLIIVV
jgi:hypothetical protein